MNNGRIFLKRNKFLSSLIQKPLERSKNECSTNSSTPWGKNIMGRLQPLLVLMCASLLALSSHGLIKEGVKDSYTIKKGDTLWKVADYFLDSPGRWPELWKANPQINNPHMLFAGDVVSLVYVKGKPQLILSNRKPEKSAPRHRSSYRYGSFAADNNESAPLTMLNKKRATIKLSPKIRVESHVKEITALPLHLVRKYISENRIFTIKAEITRAPYIFSSNNEKIGSITGDEVYAKGDFFDTSGSYEVIRPGKKIKDPVTGKVMGVLGIKVSDANLISLKNDVASLELVNSRRPVRNGDKILEKDTFVPPAIYHPKQPIESVTGKILSILAGNNSAGKYDSVLVSLGHREKIQPGDLLAVQLSPWTLNSKTNKKIKLPTKKIGIVMIYRVFDRLSYAIVMSAKEGLQEGHFLTNP